MRIVTTIMALIVQHLGAVEFSRHLNVYEVFHTPARESKYDTYNVLTDQIDPSLHLFKALLFHESGHTLCAQMLNNFAHS